MIEEINKLNNQELENRYNRNTNLLKIFYSQELNRINNNIELELNERGLI